METFRLRKDVRFNLIVELIKCYLDTILQEIKPHPRCYGKKTNRVEIIGKKNFSELKEDLGCPIISGKEIIKI